MGSRDPSRPDALGDPRRVTRGKLLPLVQALAEEGLLSAEVVDDLRRRGYVIRNLLTIAEDVDVPLDVRMRALEQAGYFAVLIRR